MNQRSPGKARACVFNPNKEEPGKINEKTCVEIEIIRIEDEATEL